MEQLVLLIIVNCPNVQPLDNALMDKSVPTTLTGECVFVSKHSFNLHCVHD